MYIEPNMKRTPYETEKQVTFQVLYNKVLAEIQPKRLKHTTTYYGVAIQKPNQSLESVKLEALEKAIENMLADNKEEEEEDEFAEFEIAWKQYVDLAEGDWKRIEKPNPSKWWEHAYQVGYFPTMKQMQELQAIRYPTCVLVLHPEKDEDIHDVMERLDEAQASVFNNRGHELTKAYIHPSTQRYLTKLMRQSKYIRPKNTFHIPELSPEELKKYTVELPSKYVGFAQIGNIKIEESLLVPKDRIYLV